MAIPGSTIDLNIEAVNIRWDFQEGTFIHVLSVKPSGFKFLCHCNTLRKTNSHETEGLLKRWSSSDHASCIARVVFEPKSPFDLELEHPLVAYWEAAFRCSGRGNAIENTIPSFAWGMIHGVTTLELDNGITKDGVVVVWHDENITKEKCRDTYPAFEGDPDFPYVGKFIANLTLAQLKTLDCGTQRLVGFPMQLTYPGTRISTLQEVLDFVACADTKHRVLWNIESKINAVHPNNTLGVQDFVQKQHAVFAASPYRYSITYQSFDWRTLIAMKELDPKIITSALADESTTTLDDGAIWLAGIRLSGFPGATSGERIASAARSIKADILSPATAGDHSPTRDPTQPGYIPFTTKEMTKRAHELGMLVKPWTANGLNSVEQLMNLGVDGIISDFPDGVRRWVEQHGIQVAPEFPRDKVLKCVDRHLQTLRVE